MWASARAELLRPGLSGGGGGRPLWLDAGLGTTATGTGTTTGVATLTGLAGFAGFLLATGNGLAASGLALTGLTATFATALAAVLVLALTGATVAFGAALALVLGVGLIVAFDAALAWAGFLGTGLVTGFFTATLALTTGLATFLGTGLAAVLGGVFNGALIGALVSDLTGVFTAGLDFMADLPTAALAAVLTLLAGLLALAEFAGFAFTACLLWEAASGWTPAPTPGLASALVFWSARDCSGCPAWRDTLKPNRWRIDTNIGLQHAF